MVNTVPPGTVGFLSLLPFLSLFFNTPPLSVTQNTLQIWFSPSMWVLGISPALPFSNLHFSLRLFGVLKIVHVLWLCHSF